LHIIITIIIANQRPNNKLNIMQNKIESKWRHKKTKYFFKMSF